MGQPRLNRWDAVWLAGAGGVFALLGIASQTAFFALFRVLLGAIILSLAVWDWRGDGHPWLPTLSWTLPVGVLWLASLGLSDNNLFLIFTTGAAVILVMMISTRAAVWWYQFVLRRPFKT